MAPELFQGEHFYGHLCDIWCIGIILFTSLTGVPPFPMPVKTDGRFQLIYTGRISELLKAWNMTDRIPPLCLDLLIHILCPAAKRYNIQQVLAHPWLN
jgi:serine/threonine protein kinase